MKPADIFAALTVVIIWGVNFVVIKIGLKGLPPLFFTSLRFVFAALPAVFFVARPAVPWRLLAGYAMFQFVVQFSLLFCGIKLGFPPGLASLVIQLQAFFTIGLAVLMLGERPGLPQIAGALIAFSGIALVAAFLGAEGPGIGFAMVIAAGFSWGLGNIFTKKMGRADALGVVTWGSLLAAPPILAVSVAIEGTDAIVASLHHLDWTSVAAIAFNAYPTTIIGFGVWSHLMRKYPTATIAPFTLLVPVAGMISAALALGESLQWWKLAAGALILAGLALNQFGGRLMRLASGTTR
ncbi:EamA family transporter [Noviherbaspirillum galbum]|uniref:EamA family transporter n=1 Tax=Noviherbaspirillum galbum TaxID=2709383 RepID=A0A6B3SL46_9BURK|nr:EamA family transporter [Noviherbaspirillum galbum]NEX61554.1 EamA family transporter [Noviherbaspirillum galbum]